MDCTTSNKSATLKQDDNNNNNNVPSNCCRAGGVTNDDDDVEQQINKATTTEQGAEDEQQVQQPSTMLVKGKRTKRPRLSSDPFPIPSSTYHHDHDHHLVDEDQVYMANCLILLAQGQSTPSSSSYSPPPSIPRNQSGLTANKRRSYSSSSLTVYECKTCNRTFPSFQALGGHRASHKKLKITTTSSSSSSHYDYLISPAIKPDHIDSMRLGNINYDRPPPTHATSFFVQSNNKSSNKIHECSICGAEFSSGQALGGHMRRHRGPVAVIPLNSFTATNTNANTTLSLSTTIDMESAAAGKADQNNNNNNGFLSLDLNLPASPSPEDTKFSLPPKQQSAAMVFSTPALVNCFY